ncbi:MAG: MipA/OmpV family protein [Ahrensia sp.]|nr:MipA/OmpV family protein [Ahrensia sp.]
MSSTKLRAYSSALLVGTALALAGQAHAADAIVGDEVPPAPVELFERSILIGAGGGFQPRYEGSDEYRGFGFPIISYDSGVDGPRRFEFRGLDDIRYHAFRWNGFSVGPLGGYRFSRDESDSQRLRGLGDIDGGLVLGGFASYEFFQSNTVRWSADVGVSTQVTGDAFDIGRFANVALPVNVRNGLSDGDYGYEIDFGLSGEYDVNDRLNLAMRLGAVYASDDYMQTYFGVNSAQAIAATAAGNPMTTFDADAGIKNVYFKIDTTYELTENIQLRAGFGYSRLLSDAADSPVTESEDQFSGTLGAAYRIRF